MDRLSTLLKHFGVSAGTYHTGGLCGSAAFDDSEEYGYLHILRAGQMTLRVAHDQEIRLEKPSLVLFPRPYRHRMIASEADDAQMVCARLGFDGGGRNPLAGSLPDYLIFGLDEVPMLGSTLEWLLDEASATHCGREAVLNRLFELVIIQLLRHMMASHSVSSGMMAGLADLRLAKAMSLMHDNPEHPWSLVELAAHCNMSRASFAAHFREVVGQTPADYLASWRVSLVQKRLREGKPVALIADEVGYESPSALARAFRRKTGESPLQWRGKYA